MAAGEGAGQPDWLAVLARAQAYLAMHQAGLADASKLERARFLLSLGVPRADAAALLGSTDESLRVMLSTAARRAKGTEKEPGNGN